MLRVNCKKFERTFEESQQKKYINSFLIVLKEAY